MGALLFVLGSAAGAVLAWLASRGRLSRSAGFALSGVVSAAACGLLSGLASASDDANGAAIGTYVGFLGTAAPLAFCITQLCVAASPTGFSSVLGHGAALGLALALGTTYATAGVVSWHGVHTVHALPSQPMAVAPYSPAGLKLPGVPAQSTAVTPFLPFDLARANGGRKVFADYMPNFPISIDNKDGDKDYYATQYLTVQGEKGVHAPYGGYLRDRPLPRAHSTRPDWRQADLETEIQQAKSVGIDGFAVDVLQAGRAASDVIDRILQAAAAVGDFSILTSADIDGGELEPMSPNDFAAAVAPYLRAPAAFRLPDGRSVLGAFAAENRPPTWWVSVLSILRDKFQLAVAFVPTFVHVADNLEAFASFSYGFSAWGGRDPRAMALADTGRGSPVDVIQRTRRLGKLWMQPVAFQDNRPRSGTFWESDNGVTNRLAWQLAEQHDAQWVQLITWNDYSESTAMAPSVVHGWRLLDMNAYDIATFKSGRPPGIVRDALYVSYRNQPVSARPLDPQTLLMRVVPTSAPPRDVIEVVAFASAPAQVFVRTGTQDYSCDVPAGRTVCTFPLSLGPISAVMSRDAVVVTTAQSNTDVTDTPRIQDLQYRVVGGLR
ncbi:endo-1,3-alpha-glucanase family glycosylhydrolase [Mycobacterium sp. 663a-19]|uniref:endo-1,3-alpha-glucanase family glycosylhydrolase n=1 Tax=Mycobacterium sp. 663a-19 TaxID=2986148 RepID=UPI002D1E6430|nr:endo-1,3-alpha-glucanase family glycosylhydrolase [Mycobacterium sp. 663a-19]MEB3980342.1 endo-1,3-alpha-glucanase family glycosylhydrolase [Mycobacterium sp. 663a-19]